MLFKDRKFYILLVEDNEGDVILLKEKFLNANVNYQMDTVTDGEQALNYVKKYGEFADASTPDLVILDINLPKINGLDFLERIKSDPETSSIPTIIFSSSKSEVEGSKAKEFGAIGFIVKGSKFSLPDLVTFADAAKGAPGMWVKVVN